MNQEPNWDEAPEGATHVLENISGYSWYKLEGGIAYVFDKVWLTSLYYEEELLKKPRFVQIPTINQQLTVVKEKFTTEEVVCSKMETTTWDGEGYPPIGTICEMYIDDVDEWVQGEVIVIHKGYLHIWNDKEKHAYFTNKSSDLRPTKSNRDKWIESIIENKEELYRQLGYRYDSIVGNKG